MELFDLFQFFILPNDDAGFLVNEVLIPLFSAKEFNFVDPDIGPEKLYPNRICFFRIEMKFVIA